MTVIAALYLLTVQRNALKRRQAVALPGNPVNIGPNWLLFGVPSVLALLIASSMLAGTGLDSDPNALVPNVVGTSLSDARAILRDAGLKTETEDDTGQDRQVFIPGNWVSTRQSPEAGARIGDTRTVTLGVVKDGEKTAAQQATENTSPTPLNRPRAHPRRVARRRHPHPARPNDHHPAVIDACDSL